MDYLKRNVELVRYNLKILSIYNLLGALVVVLLTPLFFSLVRLNYVEIARAGEMFVSVIGIILFTYIGTIEESENVHEISYIKKTSHIYIFCIRFLILLVFAFILIGSVILWAKTHDGSFPFWEITIGTLITTLYFGMVGLTVSNFSKLNSAGYLVSFSYFAFEFATAGRFTKDFYTFSLTRHSFTEKYYLLGVILVLFVVNLGAVYRKS